MGSRREARMAGTMPLISPTAARISTATSEREGIDHEPDIARLGKFGHDAVRVSLPTVRATR